MNVTVMSIFQAVLFVGEGVPFLLFFFCVKLLIVQVYGWEWCRCVYVLEGSPWIVVSVSALDDGLDCLVLPGFVNKSVLEANSVGFIACGRLECVGVLMYPVLICVYI